MSISVVIPAFNEEKRLPDTLRSLKSLCEGSGVWLSVVEVLVVDDGSVDQTEACVTVLAKEWPLLRLIRLGKNCGKGAAVRRGLLEACGDWILIADADMATPWEELERLLAWKDRADLIMGSRGLPDSQVEVRQHWVRQSMGKAFNRFQRLVVGLSFQDTQCGFKLLRNDLIFRQQVLPKLQVDRFSWDVELILWMQKAQKKVAEVPVRWQHKESSRVRIIRDSLEMLFAIYRLRSRIK